MLEMKTVKSLLKLARRFWDRLILLKLLKIFTKLWLTLFPASNLVWDSAKLATLAGKT